MLPGKRNRMSFSSIESFDLLPNLKAGELDMKKNIQLLIDYATQQAKNKINETAARENLIIFKWKISTKRR